MHFIPFSPSPVLWQEQLDSKEQFTIPTVLQKPQGGVL
jgi:hypothetical protein